jgi:MSHA biogenesis protein MshQ
MQIEHFTANGFIVSSDSDCVSYDSTNINLDTTLTTRALPEEPAATTGNFIAGKTRTIKLAAPGAGNQGKIGVSYDASDWLKYDWDPDVEIDGVVYNENPSATATFGLFRGNDRIIYQREVFD